MLQCQCTFFARFSSQYSSGVDSPGDRIIVIGPFKDRTSTNAVRRQLHDLSHKIGRTTLQPVFVSKNLEQDLKPKEIKLQS